MGFSISGIYDGIILQNGQLRGQKENIAALIHPGNMCWPWFVTVSVDTLERDGD